MSLWVRLTGTVLDYFVVGLAGVRLKNNAGVLALRNKADTADAAVIGKASMTANSIDSLTIPDGYDMIVGDDFTVTDSLTIEGRLHIV